MSTLKNTLRDNRWARWLALACLVVPMFASYSSAHEPKGNHSARHRNVISFWNRRWRQDCFEQKEL